MSGGPQAALLPDGQRLHLHHGPIDLVIGVDAASRAACFEAAAARFETILHGLVSDLEHLRQPVCPGHVFADPVAWRMARAVTPYTGVFVTPMAAVAGAVADEILQNMCQLANPRKAWVNNGGDIAVHLAGGQNMTIRGGAGDIILNRAGTFGVATSGWAGRSHSLGIADAVTVLAPNAAMADVAATLICNVVNLPGNPAISRAPATELSPDSDLGARFVTTDVAPLPDVDVASALRAGARFAAQALDQDLLGEAALMLQGQVATVSPRTIEVGELTHA